MGVIDVSCKAFFSNSRNFADLMNGVIFGGHAVAAEKLGMEESEFKKLL